MKTITMLELRKNSDVFIDALKKGVGFILTYRGKSVAKINPIKNDPENSTGDDPFFGLAKQACNCPLGKLKVTTIDDLIYDK